MAAERKHFEKEKLKNLRQDTCLFQKSMVQYGRWNHKLVGN